MLTHADITSRRESHLNVMSSEITAVIVDADLPDMDSLLTVAGVSGANVAQSNEALQQQVLISLNICWSREGQQRPAVKVSQ